MQRIKLSLMLGAAGLYGVMVAAQTSPGQKLERGLRPHPESQRRFISDAQGAWLNEIRVFWINNVQYSVRISQESLLSSPDWTPTEPLPLGFAQAEIVARQELRKLIADDSNWEVSGFHLRSVRVNLPDIDNPSRVNSTLKWYFQVEMKPSSGKRSEGADQHSDSFWVFIDLSGKAGTTQTHRP